MKTIKVKVVENETEQAKISSDHICNCKIARCNYQTVQFGGLPNLCSDPKRKTGRVLAFRYCILGFEYNEPKRAEFYQSISYDILQTTDDWDKIKYFKTLEEAEIVRLELRECYNDYGWYVVICNAC